MGKQKGEYTVVGIGEILWDLLPQGKKIGGAPANFAYHCKNLGLKSHPVSCLGDDDLGKEILRELEKHSLDTSYIAIDPSASTGTVSVELDPKGNPEYKICEDVAWDFIPLTDEMIKLAGKTNIICFGSLAWRSKISAQTIKKFIQAADDQCIKIFDINLRQHYYNHDLIEEMLELSSVLKLNQDELTTVAGLFGITGSERTLIEKLANHYSLTLVALTKGSSGSCIFQNGFFSEHGGYQTKVIDTVGAGDSFTAVLAWGLLHNYSLNKINDIANKTAAYICSRAGAMAEIPGREKLLI